MQKTTFSDWWASRTMRFNTYATAFMTAVLPVVATFTDADWAAFGIPPRAVTILVVIVAMMMNLKNMNLRTKTDEPLAGLADKK